MVPLGYGVRSTAGKCGESSVSLSTLPTPSHDHGPARRPADTSAPRPPLPSCDPHETWALCAPALTQRSRIRLAERRGGRASDGTYRVQYPARLARPLSAHATRAPAQPAAIHVYDEHGQTRMWPLDLDAHDRTTDQLAQVTADLHTLRQLLDDIGALYLVDHAHGGAHVYVLLEYAVGMETLTRLTLALGQLLPSLDPSPVRNATDGLITVPGSAHRLGGHRQLETDLEETEDLLSNPGTPDTALMLLERSLAPQLRAVREQDDARAANARDARRANGETDLLTPADIKATITAGQGRSMSLRYSELAITGDWRAHDFPSPSEARRGVLMSAISVGFTETEVRRRISDGTWPGLHALFAHKGLSRIHDEYQRAAEEITRRERRSSATSQNTDDHVDMNRPTHSGGRALSHHQAVRTWRTLLAQHGAAEYPGTQGWPALLVLRALAKASHLTASLEVEVGCRWIELATGLSRSTVAATLRALASAPDPWITHQQAARGRRADRYRLRIPERHREHAHTPAWIPGKAHALRPAFTVLGTPAALLYEALEHQYGTASTAHLARVTGLSRDARREGLLTLHAHGLIEPGPDADTWTITATDADLDRLAEQLGATAARAARHERHRTERRIWHAKLDAFTAQTRAARSRSIRYARTVTDPQQDEIERTLAAIRSDASPPPLAA